MGTRVRPQEPYRRGARKQCVHGGVWIWSVWTVRRRGRRGGCCFLGHVRKYAGPLYWVFPLVLWMTFCVEEMSQEPRPMLVYHPVLHHLLYGDVHRVWNAWMCQTSAGG